MLFKKTTIRAKSCKWLSGEKMGDGREKVEDCCFPLPV